jgi:O-antigen ligase
MEYLGDERTLVSTIKGFIVGIVLYSVLTLSYFLVGSAHPLASLFETQRYSFVTRITYHNENYFLIAFPLLLLLILQLKGGLTKKIWLMAGLVLLSSQLFISLNRTTLVLVVASIGISLVFYEMFWRRSGLLKSSFSTILLVGGLILVIGYLLITQILPALYGVNSLEFLSHWMGRFDITSRYVYQASVANRIDMFRAGLQAILDSPVFGHGYGFLFRIKGWIGLVSFIDSTWITVWIRSGLVGVALLFGIVVIYSRSILRVLRSGDVQNVYVRVFYCALAGGGIGLLIQSLVKDSMLINSTAVLPLLIIVGASMQYSENLFRNALNQKN